GRWLRQRVAGAGARGLDGGAVLPAEVHRPRVEGEAAVALRLPLRSERPVDELRELVGVLDLKGVERGAVGARKQAGLPLGVEEAEAAEAGVGEARGEDALAAAGRAAHGDDEAAGLRAAAEGVERRAHGCGGRFARKDAEAYAAPAASRVSHVGLKVTGLKVTGLKVTGLKVTCLMVVGPS